MSPKLLPPIFMQQPDDIQFNLADAVPCYVPRCVFCFGSLQPSFTQRCL